MKPAKININTLRVRFAFGFSILFTFFLAIALIFIYVSFAEFRKKEFYTFLEEKAITTANLLFEVERVDSSLLREIDKNTPSHDMRQVTIFKDSAIIYNSSDDREIFYTPGLFNKIKSHKEVATLQGENEVLGILKSMQHEDYIIIAYGYDSRGFRKLKFLKWVMIIAYCLGIFLGWIATFFFVNKIIKPLDNLKNKLNNINYNNLDTRFPETRQGEEVNSLSANFNKMLDRLEKSFSFQKDFVHYASHELRTPLTAMVGLTESSLNNSTTPEQYRKVLNQLLTQQKNLTDITNSLLLLSGSNITFKSHEYPMIRLDELVFRSIEIMKELFPDSTIEIDLEGDLANENLLLIHANEPLIIMAFNNLIKNGLQYSPVKKISIIMVVSEKERKIKFINTGNYLSPEEREKIFTPFYRASEAIAIKGHGLGLPLVKQIVQLHKGTIRFTYENGLNIFDISFN